MESIKASIRNKTWVWHMWNYIRNYQKSLFVVELEAEKEKWENA